MLDFSIAFDYNWQVIYWTLRFGLMNSINTYVRWKTRVGWGENFSLITVLQNENPNMCVRIVISQIIWIKNLKFNVPSYSLISIFFWVTSLKKNYVNFIKKVWILMNIQIWIIIDLILCTVHWKALYSTI